MVKNWEQQLQVTKCFPLRKQAHVVASSVINTERISCTVHTLGGVLWFCLQGCLIVVLFNTAWRCSFNVYFGTCCCVLVGRCALVFMFWWVQHIHSRPPMFSFCPAYNYATSHKKFSERKQVHVGMEASKINQTRWE